MVRRISWLLLVFLILSASLCAQAETCELCDDKGYLEMPVFGTNELIQVNCTACGVIPSATKAPTEPAVTAQPTDALRLVDPGDYANGDDQCVYAESWYAVFECEEGYDIDGYIAALTASAGLEVTGLYELSDETDTTVPYEMNRCYQLTYPDFAGALYLNTCHVSVFYNDYSGRVSLAVADGGNVLLPDRARNLKFYTWMPGSWMPECKSITLPDVLPYANGEDQISQWTAGSMIFHCPEGYDIDGYINLLRYQYGFDVEAVTRDYGTGATRYALYNPGIDARLFKTDDSSEFTGTKRQLEISYTFDGILSLITADCSSIQLPLRPGTYFADDAELIDLKHRIPAPYTDMYRASGTRHIYIDKTAGWCQNTVRILSTYENFDITGIVEDGNAITYYLFAPGFHDLRLSNGISHMSVTHDADTEEVIFDFISRSIVMPKPEPRPTPAPRPTDDNRGGGGGSSSGEWCSACANSGKCSGCGGNKQIRRHVAGTTDYIYQDCLTCFGDGKCPSCGGDGWR